MYGLAASYCHGFLIKVLSELKGELGKYNDVHQKLIILVSEIVCASKLTKPFSQKMI